jgi:hypothetical protein
MATAGAHQSAYGGFTDAFLVKFNASGVRQWGTFYGGIGDDYGYSCSTDASGNVYLAGRTDSNTGTIIATTGAHQSAYGGGLKDAFLVKFFDCVNLSPVAAVNGTVCSGASINFTASITGTATPTYSWAGPNSYTANVQNPSIAGAGTLNIGTYSLTINSSGCIQTATTQVSAVNALPTVAVNSGSICSGNNFTIIPSGASTYTIQGGSANVTPTANASYTVIGTSTAGCVSANTATSNVTVNSQPIVSVNNGTICSGNSFTIIPSGASTYTIQGGSANVTPTANASYTVIGTSTAGCVSANTATSNVTVNSQPIVSVNNGTICSGNSFTIIPSGASTYTIQGGSANVTPTANASYTVIGTSTAGCVSANTATSNVTVNTNPTVTAASSNTSFICVGSSATLTATGASTYVWNTTATTAVIVVSPNTTTSYTVTGTGANGCTANAVISQSVSTCTDLNSNFSNLTSNFIVYPNPTNSVINIEFLVFNNESYTIEIVNIVGQVLHKETVTTKNLTLKTDNLQNGVYFVKATVDGKTKTVKLVKE